MEEQAPVVKTHQAGQWTITTRTSRILAANEITEWEESLGLPMPEMVFGLNQVEFRHNGGLVINLNARDALALVDKTGTNLKVTAAETFFANRSEETMKDVDPTAVKPFDWTYTTEYHGTVTRAEGELAVGWEDTENGIDYEALKRPDPIEFFDELILYEDELGDSGTCLVNVRLRVMAERWFALLSCFVRVDGVLSRAHETRFYHDYSSDFVLREVQAKSATHEQLLKRVPRAMHDPAVLGEIRNIVPHLDLTSTVTQRTPLVVL